MSPPVFAIIFRLIYLFLTLCLSTIFLFFSVLKRILGQLHKTSVLHFRCYFWYTNTAKPVDNVHNLVYKTKILLFRTFPLWITFPQSPPFPGRYPVHSYDFVHSAQSRIVNAFFPKNNILTNCIILVPFHGMTPQGVFVRANTPAWLFVRAKKGNHTLAGKVPVLWNALRKFSGWPGSCGILHWIR